MSQLSGYDSEAVGFDSVTQKKRSDATIATQTCFAESGTGSQTNFSKDCGCTASPRELNAEDDILREYPPPGLNDFLRKVVPSMLEQLDQSERELEYQSSESEDDDTLTATVVQELHIKGDSGSTGAGDYQPSILGVTWSSAGNTLAVSVGQAQHENWCQHDGLIRVYTVKRSEQNKLVHTLDISEKNCVSVLKYHPSVAALLAYGTTSGEVVLCNLLSFAVEDGTQLSSPSGCHGSKRVSALQWADAPLANMFLVAQITKTGKRRGASDQVLLSSGSDGTVNVWQVNANLKIFEVVVTYTINSSKNTGAPDITCFDFIKVFPLRPYEEKMPDDIFVVGTNTGRLYLCKTKLDQISQTSCSLDPVCEMLEGHSACVLELAFSLQRPGVFASLAADSELRVYDVNQAAPLKVLCLDVPISCMAWLPNNPCIAVLGLSRPERQIIKVYNANSGRPVKIDGMNGEAGILALAINQTGGTRIAAGDTEGFVRIFDIPSRKIKLAPEDYEF